MKKLFLLLFAAGAFTFMSCNGCNQNASDAADKMEETANKVEEATEEVVKEVKTAMEPKVEEVHKVYTTRHTAKPKPASAPAPVEKKVKEKTVVYEYHPPVIHHEHDDDAVKKITTMVKEKEVIENTAPLVDTKGYYFLPMHWATFPGGEAALDKFLANNLRYPEDALERGVEGTVFTALYVDEKGEVVDYSFPGKKLGYGCEEEVARVIKLMPRWEPGAYNNAKVKSKFTIPIKFRIVK